MVNVSNPATKLHQTQLLSFRREESTLTKKLAAFFKNTKSKRINDFFFKPVINLRDHRAKMTVDDSHDPEIDNIQGAQGGHTSDISSSFTPLSSSTPFNSPSVERKEPTFTPDNASTVIYNHIQDPGLTLYVLNPASHDFTKETANSYYVLDLENHKPFDFEKDSTLIPLEPKDDRLPVELPWSDDSQLKLNFFYEKNGDDAPDIEGLTNMLSQMKTQIE